MLRRLLLLPLLGLGPLPAPDAAASCETLQAGAFGNRSFVILGERDEEPSEPALALPGCGGASPRLVRRWVRDAAGRWSTGQHFPPGEAGAVLEHRDGLLRGELLQDAALAGGPVLRLGALGAPAVAAAVAVPVDPGARSVAVARLDRWQLAVAQDLRSGRLRLEELTSHGSGGEFERLQLIVTEPDWPRGWRLLAVAGEADRVLAFARAPDGALLAGQAVDGRWSELPSLAAEARAEMRGLMLAGAPAALLQQAGRVVLWQLDGGQWHERDGVELAGGGPFAATVMGEARDGLVLARWTGAALQAWSWSSDGWRGESVPAGSAPAALAPEPSPPRPARPAPSRWLLVLAGTAVLAGSALVFRLVRR